MTGLHSSKEPVPWALIIVLSVFCAACITLGAIYA